MADPRPLNEARKEALNRPRRCDTTRRWLRTFHGVDDVECCGPCHDDENELGQTLPGDIGPSGQWLDVCCAITKSMNGTGL